MNKILDAAAGQDEQRELHKIKKWLQQADRSYYHRIIQHRKTHGSIFPHCRNHEYLFSNTFQYINLFSKNRG